MSVVLSGWSQKRDRVRETGTDKEIETGTTREGKILKRNRNTEGERRKQFEYDGYTETRDQRKKRDGKTET